MYWQDSVTYAARFNLVNQMSLRGVGFWTLNYAGGAPELWSTLRTYFVSCASTGVNASPATPQLSGTTVTLTATSTACVNPRYQFWLLPPGGIWTVVQAYSSNPTYTWTTGGKPFGTYRFSIWARDANSPGINGAAPTTYDAFFASPYVLTTSPCTATSLSESPPTMAPGGTIVTITGGATGCPNPSYQFWIQPPGGTWLIARAYATSPSFAWNTNGKNLGSYNFSVWAQDASSLGTTINAVRHDLRIPILVVRDGD